MNLEEIKKRFEESLSDNAIDTMKTIVEYEGLSTENQELLFNYTFDQVPELNNNEFYYFLSDLDIDSPDEEYDPEINDCTEQQFLLRKVLMAAAIELLQESVDTIVGDFSGYYDYYFIQPSSVYNGNRLVIKNSEVIEAIQEIIDSQKK